MIIELSREEVEIVCKALSYFAFTLAYKGDVDKSEKIKDVRSKIDFDFEEK